MKKSIKTLALTLAALGLLTGCTIGGKTSSSASSASNSSSQPSSSSEPAGPDWSAADKALMSENLHGLFLPYVGIEGVAIEEIQGQEGVIGFENVAIEEGYIAEYADLFLDEEWEDVTDQYLTPAQMEQFEGAFYMFQKAADAQGKTGALAQLFGKETPEATAPSTAGPMYCWAMGFQPAAWPAEEVAEGLAQIGITTDALPALEVDSSYYSVYVGTSKIQIAAQVESEQEAITSYQATLVAANYTNIGPDSYGDLHFLSEHSEADVCIWAGSDIGYDGYVFIDVAKYVDPDAWPAASIAAAFVTAGETAFEVPALEGEGFAYEFSDSYVSSYGVAAVYVSGETVSAATLTVYKGVLETAGWTVTGSEDDGFTAKKQVADGVQKIEFSYSSYYEEVSIYIYLALDPLPSATWPTSQIAEYLGTGVTDVLPAFEGEATAYSFFEDGYILISVADAEAAVTAYQATLATAGFEEGFPDSYGDMQYISPNFQFVTCVYEGNEEGTIVIDLYDISYVAGFPVSVVNEFLAENELGFTFGANAFDSMGITLSKVAYGGTTAYPYITVTVSGNRISDFDAIIKPVVEAAGYELASSSETAITYSNDNDSQVRIWYTAASDTTTVRFWK